MESHKENLDSFKMISTKSVSQVHSNILKSSSSKINLSTIKTIEEKIKKNDKKIATNYATLKKMDDMLKLDLLKEAHFDDIEFYFKKL